MADVSPLRPRPPLVDFLRARLAEEADAAQAAILHAGRAHFTVTAEVAAHIGRWDPARVLTDLRAKAGRAGRL
jgi:hypothetical protein